MEKIPHELTKLLARSSDASAQWESLTVLARRDFLIWIASAKQEETQLHRIERTGEMLEEGKRRPCCFSLVPTELYQMFVKNPEAKANWSKLTGEEKRDFSSWIHTAKQPESYIARINQASASLTQGKRQP